MTSEEGLAAGCPPRDVVARAGLDHAEIAKRIRRTHHKSRTGCKPCKMRRVKCDENRPSCGNCVKRDERCEYFDTPRARSHHPMERMKLPPLRCSHLGERPLIAAAPMRPHDLKLASRGPSLSTSASNTLHPYGLGFITIGTPADKILDLHLFHHYLKMAASTQKVQPTWSSWIANQALQTPSVMDALLGFSAFHLRRNGDGDPAIREASHKYMARAIRSHKEQLLGDINEANAPGIVACCSLILIHGSVNQSYLSSEKEHPLPVHWFRPFQSVRALFILTLPWIQDAEIGPAIRKLPSPVEILSRGSRFTKFDFLLEDMSPDELLDHQTLTAYRQAVNHLSFIYCCRDQARPLRFLVMASSRFVEMLEAKDPRTLAIVGYFFMLLEIVHLLWWVDGAPAREFAAVMEYLPEAWWPKMSWAIRVFKWKK